MLIFIAGIIFHFIDDPKHIYLITKILVPTIINVIASFVALYVNASEKFDNSMKCFVCSFVFATIGGSISFWNGYYVVLWCLPILAVIFCSVFHDMQLLFSVTVYSIILVAMSAFFQMLMYPEEYSYFLQSMLVVMLDLIVTSFIYLLKK